VKKVESKRSTLLANLGDFSRPLRVRPVRYMSREWWAIDAEDTWPGMVMDLRRLGFESVALEDEVLVREDSAMYEPQMEGPFAPTGLKTFPVIHPTITVRKESYLTDYAYLDRYSDYIPEEDEDEEAVEDMDVYEYGIEDEEEDEDLDINV
jgi:hypothetical protein